ncbi:MAG: hypothetical protein WA364_23015 [Candidatus Nitrosopolaris sp.]
MEESLNTHRAVGSSHPDTISTPLMQESKHSLEEAPEVQEESFMDWAQYMRLKTRIVRFVKRKRTLRAREAKVLQAEKIS